MFGYRSFKPTKANELPELFMNLCNDIDKIKNTYNEQKKKIQRRYFTNLSRMFN